MEKLQALSPLDGRYANKIESLRAYFGEEALINFRIKTECEYLIFLLKELRHRRAPSPLNSAQQSDLRSIYSNQEQNAFTVKKIEFSGLDGLPATNHDVKAVEYYLRKILKDKKLEKYSSFLHFGLTSEDINNISYSAMIGLSLKNELIPAIDSITEKLKLLSIEHSDVPLLARTHGQPAVGTTFGKEFRVFYERLKKIRNELSRAEISIKLNGAVGNYNALNCAYPRMDWPLFSEKFASYLSSFFKLKFRASIHTTQIESHDSWINIFQKLNHLNQVLISLNQDIWRYISDDLIIQIPLKGEIGSSTMPQKVNPIDFENSEGNLGLACALLSFFCEKLPKSRLQRDLSDSTVERSIGSAFGYSLIGYKSLLKGLGKIKINAARSASMLLEHPEVYAEAIQTILRRENYPEPYEALKDFTRGRKITRKDLSLFIKSLKIKLSVKRELLKLLSKPYIGLAGELAVKNIKKEAGHAS